MKKNLLAAIFAVLFCPFLKAQKNYQQGYVVTNTGDTLKGEVDYKNWVQNPERIVLKTSKKEVEYDAVKDIQGFGVNGKAVYVRKQISLNMTPFEPRKLLRSNQWIVVADTTLMIKQLVKGRISLFNFQDLNGKTHFFVQKEGKVIEELVDHYYLRNVNGTLFEAHNDLYNNQLYGLCEDCTTLKDKLFKYPFLESTFTNLVIKYNACFGDKQALLTSPKESYKVGIYARAGMGIYQYETFNDVSSYYSSNAGLATTSFGGQLLVELPSLRKKLEAKLDLLFTQYAQGVQFLNSSYTPPQNVPYISVCLAPQYAFYKKNNTTVYANLGLSLDFKLGNKNGSGIYGYETGTIVGYKLGAGFRYKKMDVELGYYQTDVGLGKYLNLGGNMSRFGLSVGYDLLAR